MRLQPTATCKPDKHPMAPHAIGFFCASQDGGLAALTGQERPWGRAGIPAICLLARRQGGAIVAKDVVLAPVKVSGTVRGGIPTFRGKPCAGG